MESTVKSGIKNIPVAFMIIFMAFVLLRYPATTSTGVTNGLSLCAAVVIPSLFPFMILSAFIVKSGFYEKLGKLFEPFTRLFFKLPGNAGSAIVMSLIGGFPVGAKITADLLDLGSITREQARRMMLFCVNAGPAFVINAVGYAMLGSVKSGVILYVSLVVSSLFVGFLTGFLSDESEDKNRQPAEKSNNKKISYSDALVQSASDGASSMFMVCVWVIVFTCVGALISSLPIGQNAAVALKCLLEVTSGCAAAAGNYALPVLASVLGWAGFSVHFQILQYVNKTGLKASVFLAARAINGAVCAVVCKELIKIFPIDALTMSNAAFPYDITFSTSVPAAGALIIMSAFLILDLDTKHKMW